jgi:anaerobic selenocysteine-containing dehydrogenase
VTKQARVGFDDLRAADGPVVAEQTTFGWVDRTVLGAEGWRLAPAVLVEQLRDVSEPADLVLIPRRQPRVMNGQPRTDTTHDRFEILVHETDAQRLGVADGALSRLESVTGSITGPVRIDESVLPGTVSVPHGWANANVNALISSRTDVDGLTGMARQSGTPVSLSPVSQ